MLIRLSASKDTFVSDEVVLGQRVVSSSAGASEILETFYISSPSATASILIMFPTSSISVITAMYSASITASSYVSNPLSWHLTLKNVETENPIASNFDLDIVPVAQSWDEGNGQDIDYWTDVGYANFNYANSNTLWPTPGARPLSNISATAHFDTGHEDLDVDVTSLMSSSQFGFWIGLQEQYLSGVNYYLKAFRSRQTHYPQYQPYLEARWNDFTGSYSSTFIDIVDATGILVGAIYNLQSVYDVTETPILRTHFRPKDWNLSIVTTGSSDVSGTVLTNAYWRIKNNTSDEVLIPFTNAATGAPITYTKISYDDNGNYFMFPMQNLVPGIVYKFDIGYYDANGAWHVNNGNDLTFRVN